jgi:putative salt-induced outer membrane protein YdiY
MLRKLSIALALLLCSAVARADTLMLANGDELTGEIVEWALDYVVIEHPQLGRVRLSLEQLDIDTGVPPNPGLFGTSFLRGWNRHIEAGWNGKRGNSTSMNVTSRLNLDYADEFRRWSITGRYFFQSGDDDDSENNARLDLRRDWLFPGHDVFAFASLRYQYDKFESWIHRTVLSVGPGYHLVQTENHSLDVRLGATFTREYSGDQRESGEGLLGIDYAWKITRNQSFHVVNQLYAEFTPNAGELRNWTQANYRIGLAEAPALSLNTGVENEYDTDPDPGDKSNDLKYYVSLGLDF